LFLDSSQIGVHTLLDDSIHVVIKENLVDLVLHIVEEVLLLHFGRLAGGLFSVVVSHVVRVHGQSQSEEVQLGLAAGGDFGVAVLTPVGAPGVLDDPGIGTVGRRLPAKDLENMVALEAEGVGRALVDAFAVSEQVGVRGHLSKHGSVRQDLSLDAVNLLGDAEVNDFVDVVGLAALVLLEVLLGALSLLTNARVAGLGDEASALAPRQHLVHSAAEAVWVLVAVDQLLGGQGHLLFLAILADAVFNGGESRVDVAGSAILSANRRLLDALGGLLTPVVALGDDHLEVLTRAALFNFGVVRQTHFEELLRVGNRPVLSIKTRMSRLASQSVSLAERAGTKAKERTWLTVKNSLVAWVKRWLWPLWTSIALSSRTGICAKDVLGFMTV
jgi:hypothetical protein